MYSQGNPDRSYSSAELEDIKRWYIKDNLPLHEVARRVNDKHYHGDMFRTEKALESKLLRLKIYKKAPKPDAIDVDKKYAHIADLKKKMSYTQIADETGLSVGSVKNIINKVKTGHSTAQAVSMDDLKEKVVYFFKHKSGTGPTSIIDLSNKLEVHPAKVQETIESLKKDHYNFETLDSSIELSSTIKPEPPMKIDSKSFFKSSGKIIRFGAIGDTHLCSLYARENCLQVMYDIYEREGINKVFLAGNMIDGERPFNKYDIHTHGVEGQVDYFIKNFPRRKGIETHFITGDDHEGWIVRDVNLNIGDKIQHEAEKTGRKDLIYIGHMERDIELEGARTSQRIRVTHPGGGSCFDDTAEILTKDRGWIKFSELSLNDEVATMTKFEHRFEWQKPTHITDEPYDGDLIHFKARCFDFRVTPNHGLWVRYNRSYHTSLQPKEMPQKAHNRNRVDWHREDAQFVYEHYSRQNFSIPTVSDNWIGELIPVIEVPRLACLVKENKRNELQMQHVGNQKIEDMAELIAWYVTEGYADKKRVAICQSLIANPKNHKHITDLVSRMGLRYSVSGRDNKDICIGSTELSAWLKEQCGHLSRHKYLPLWLKNQPKDILNIVFKTMVSGDGWKTGRSFGYKSISKRLRHDMCEIAQKLGYATTESKDTVHIRMVQNLPTINSKPTRVKYNGKIYCCSVPNELIYVRCNGKAFWSHNSYALSYTSQKYAESLTGGDKPRVVLCFTPETPVIMGNGKLKPIRTIKGGDKVLAEDSKICEVIEQVGSMYKGEVISIIASGIHDDRAWCKPDHPIYCLRKSGIIDYIPAKKVQVGDYVLTPSKNGKTPSIVSRYGAPGMTVTKDGFWRPVVEILKNEYNGPMYDLRVDDMNSYVANYYLVHNCGHYHKLEYCYPREIHMIQVGAFQDQTPFMRKKRLQSMVGGAIVELHQDDEGIINRCKVEFVTFYDKQFYEYKWK